MMESHFWCKRRCRMPPTNFYTEHWNLVLGSIFTFVCCLVGCPKYYGNYSSKRQSPSFWKDYYPIFIWRPKVMKNLPFPLVGNFPTVIGCNSPHHRSAKGLSWIYLTLQQRFFTTRAQGIVHKPHKMLLTKVAEQNWYTGSVCFLFIDFKINLQKLYPAVWDLLLQLGQGEAGAPVLDSGIQDLFKVC